MVSTAGTTRRHRFESCSDYRIIIMEGKTFIESDNIDGQWLSPILSEREWQEQKLIEIFGHYPNASPRWQYLNGLIQIALEHIELIKQK